MSTKFGWVSPAVLEKQDREDGFTRRFLTQLHDEAVGLQELLSFEGTEGDRAYGLEYFGKVVGNYPWLYIDFKITGDMPLENLLRVETSFKKICADSERLASYLTTTVGDRVLRCRLIYRADMPRRDPL